MARVHDHGACNVAHDTHAALTRCSYHACLLALPCPTGGASPQDVMACSYTGCLCVLSLRNGEIIFFERMFWDAMYDVEITLALLW